MSAIEQAPGWAELSEHDREELRRFEQWIGVEASRRADGLVAVYDTRWEELLQLLGPISMGGVPEA